MGHRLSSLTAMARISAAPLIRVSKASAVAEAVDFCARSVKAPRFWLRSLAASDDHLGALI